MAEYINRGDLTIWLNKKSCEYNMNDVVPIGWTLKGLAIMAVLLVICSIILVIDRIAYAMKKRQQKRINDAFKEEAE